MTRGNLGRMEFVSNPDEVRLEEIINHISKNCHHLYSLKPKQAEKLLPHVLSDYLDCEVKVVGGTKDGGINAWAIRGNNERILIQIKWREDKKVAESVGVVREVGGTLLIIIDMFEVSCRIRNEKLPLEGIIPYYNDGSTLFGDF